MEHSSEYKKYVDCLTEITGLLLGDALSQSSIEKNERETVSEIESQYQAHSEKLEQAKRAVQEQYQSVWDSCSREAGIKWPRAQRPEVTDLPWEEAVRAQQQAASEIRGWFVRRSQQAFLDRQAKLRIEAAKKEEEAIARAEAEKLAAEEAAQAAKERAEKLIDKMKQKYRE